MKAKVVWDRPLSGSSTRPMSAAWPCPPATSSPKKHQAWSLTCCAISSTSKHTCNSNTRRWACLAGSFRTTTGPARASSPCFRPGIATGATHPGAARQWQ